MYKILITGGSGMIGTKLTEMLLDKGYEVSHLGRSKKGAKFKTFTWDVQSRKMDQLAFQGVDTIVHLAGANVGSKPWTSKRKKEILESRIHSTRLLFDFLKKGDHTIRTFVSASAIGYYGFDHDDKVFVENDPPGQGFLAEVVKKWEAAVDEIASLPLRVVKVRVGIVLSRDGGALKEIARPVRFYVGAPLGSGEQKMSWIHIDDVCATFIKAIEDQTMSGPFNAVGPSAISNKELTKAIGRVLKRPIIIPGVPGFALKALLGEMADLVLKGSAVSNQKLVGTGFTYRFPTLDSALEDLLKEGE